MILLAMLTALQAPAPAATDSWRTCVVDTAEKWAMNRDGADVVADGAFGACQSAEPAQVSEQDLRRTKQAAIAAVLKKRRP